MKYKIHMMFVDPPTNSVGLNVCSGCGSVVVPSKESDHDLFHQQIDTAVRLYKLLVQATRGSETEFV